VIISWNLFFVFGIGGVGMSPGGPPWVRHWLLVINKNAQWEFHHRIHGDQDKGPSTESKFIINLHIDRNNHKEKYAKTYAVLLKLHYSTVP